MQLLKTWSRQQQQAHITAVATTGLQPAAAAPLANCASMASAAVAAAASRPPEITMAVIRPRTSLVQLLHGAQASLEFRAKRYDILLMDVKRSISDKTKVWSQLPRVTLCLDEQPAQAAINFLEEHLHGMGGVHQQQTMTASAATQATVAGVSAGVVEKVVPVPAVYEDDEPASSCSDVTNQEPALYLLPLSIDVQREKQLQGSSAGSGEELVMRGGSPSGYRLRWYPLDQVLDSCLTDTSPYGNHTKFLLHTLHRWLRNKHQQSRGIEALFRPARRVPVLCSAINPVFRPQDAVGDSGGGVSAAMANEALANMMAVEKCDIVVMNPLFGSGLVYKVGENGVGGPVNMERSMDQSSNGSHVSGESLTWLESFPMHKAAYEGNTKHIKELLHQGYSSAQPDRDSWMPIHYAAWYGQLGAIQALLNHGSCPANIANNNGSTPLHFAARCGHPYVVELLLNHPDIDANVQDKDGKTPLDLCENIRKQDWMEAAMLLRRSIHKTISPKIAVYLPDGSNVMLNLVCGADTTVEQLHQQMLQEISLSPEWGHVFTFWICSKNLQLQLKMEHKPKYHLREWKRKVVTAFTEVSDPLREEPKLYFRRNAHLTLTEEKKVQNAVAISLLYHEAHQNFLTAYYPCRDDDAAILGALLLQIVQGDYENRKTKSFLASPGSLEKFLPITKVNSKNVNWVQKIASEHKHITNKSGKNMQTLQYQFVAYCWNIRVYGSAFFHGMAFFKRHKGARDVLIGVNHYGLHLIDSQSRMLYESFPHRNMECIHSPERPYLEIRPGNNESKGVTVRTKQADVIHQLIMKMLAAHASSAGVNS